MGLLGTVKILISEGNSSGRLLFEPLGRGFRGLLAKMGSIARTKYNNLCLTPRRLRVAALLLMLVGSVYVKEYIADIILMRRAGPEQQHTEQQAQAMKQGMLRREIAMPWAPSEGRMINAVITGGAGYIGSHMALLLLDDGHFNVTIIDNLSRSFEVTIRRLQKYARGVGKEGLLHWRHMELSDQRGVERVFREGATDLVLHFAGNAYVPESVAFPEMYRLNITVTTDRMVNAMLSAKVRMLATMFV